MHADWRILKYAAFWLEESKAVVFRTSLLFLLNWASTQSAHWYQFSRHKSAQPSIVPSKPHHHNYTNDLKGFVWRICRDGHDTTPCLKRLWPQFAVNCRLKVELLQLSRAKTLHTCKSVPILFSENGQIYQSANNLIEAISIGSLNTWMLYIYIYMHILHLHYI